MSAIAENLKCVQDRIARAAHRSGRSEDAVKLIVCNKDLACRYRATGRRCGDTDFR